MDDSIAIGFVGLDYVGLPLAIEFVKCYCTIGNDFSSGKISRYSIGVDSAGEDGADDFIAAKNFCFTVDPSLLSDADFIIVAVPTSVDNVHRIDVGPLQSASLTVGRFMKAGCTVIFESTVYPGSTSDVCVPLLEEASKRKWRYGFFVGYSPERINPGDRFHGLRQVVKVVSGNCATTLDKVATLYEQGC